MGADPNSVTSVFREEKTEARREAEVETEPRVKGQGSAARKLGRQEGPFRILQGEYGYGDTLILDCKQVHFKPAVRGILLLGTLCL